MLEESLYCCILSRSIDYAITSFNLSLPSFSYVSSDDFWFTYSKPYPILTTFSFPDFPSPAPNHLGADNISSAFLTNIDNIYNWRWTIDRVVLNFPIENHRKTNIDNLQITFNGSTFLLSNFDKTINRSSQQMQLSNNGGFVIFPYRDTITFVQNTQDLINFNVFTLESEQTPTISISNYMDTEKYYHVSYTNSSSIYYTQGFSTIAPVEDNIVHPFYIWIKPVNIGDDLTSYCTKQTQNGSISKLSLLEWLKITVSFDYKLRLEVVTWYKTFLDLIDFQLVFMDFIANGLSINMNDLPPRYKDFEVATKLIKEIPLTMGCSRPIVNIYCGGNECPDDFCEVECNNIKCCYDPVTGEPIASKKPRETKLLNGVTINIY